MKNRIALIALLAAFALVLLGAVSAQAATITATQQFSGTVINGSGTPDNWSSVTFATPTAVTFYAGGGDFLGAQGFDATISSSIPITNNLPGNLDNLLTWTVGGNPVSFSAQSEQILSQTAGTLTLYFLGYTTDTGYSSSYSSLTWSIAYNPGSGTSSWSATWSSPPTPPTNTPEPTSMVLFGLGLGMMGYIGYRQKSRTQINLVAGL